MMKQTLFSHELIGQHITVVGSTNAAQVGMTGKIVDETKMTLVVGHAQQRKTLLKSNIIFTVGNSHHLIRGKEILKRPEERLKGK